MIGKTKDKANATNASVLKTRALRLLGAGFVIAAIGTVVSLVGSPGQQITLYGWIGIAAVTGGLAMVFWALELFSKLEREGSPNRAPPDPTEDPGPIEWIENSYRKEMLKRERLYRLLSVPVVAFLFATIVLNVLGFGGSLGSNIWVIISVEGSLFIAMSLSTITLTNGFQRESRYAPTRVGLSQRGIHIDLDLSDIGKKGTPKWLSRYIPWDEVEGMSATAAFGSTHWIRIQRTGGGFWFLNGLDADIVAKVLSVWDFGVKTSLR